MVRELLLLAILSVISCMKIGSGGCQHPIFCNTTILEAVAKSNFYKDSKTFVDQVLQASVEQVQQQFQKLKIDQFLTKYFSSGQNILQTVNLPDYKPSPQTLSHLTKPQLKQFAVDLNKRWNQLARKVNLDYSKTKCKSQCSTFLPEMNGKTIIVPGGRFMESYYWDSYWIIKGLIVCDLLDTAQQLIDNFVDVIDRYGFIPNGFRLYYLNRSQPPFFFLMVKQVVQALIRKGQLDRASRLQKKAYTRLVSQHQYFMKTHSKPKTLSTQKQILLNYYNAQTTSPRPESFREDWELVQSIASEQEKSRVLKGISSMAESGWDFSSRWLNKSTKDLKANVIEDIFPSDLNSLMGLMEDYLSTLSAKYGQKDLVNYFQKLYKDRKQYFNEIFNGNNFPDISNIKKRGIFQIYPSDFYPFLLFPQKKAQIDAIYNSTVNPISSIFENGFQWDKPNVWAPNNWIIHEVVAEKQALVYARQWVATVYCSWKKQGLIYEKYRYDVLGKRGEGGEYTVQTGFGWTNGLVLYYLKLYGDQLVVPICP